MSSPLHVLPPGLLARSAGHVAAAVMRTRRLSGLVPPWTRESHDVSAQREQDARVGCARRVPWPCRLGRHRQPGASRAAIDLAGLRGRGAGEGVYVGDALRPARCCLHRMSRGRHGRHQAGRPRRCVGGRHAPARAFASHPSRRSLARLSSLVPLRLSRVVGADHRIRRIPNCAGPEVPALLIEYLLARTQHQFIFGLWQRSRRFPVSSAGMDGEASSSGCRTTTTASYWTLQDPSVSSIRLAALNQFVLAEGLTLAEEDALLWDFDKVLAWCSDPRPPVDCSNLLNVWNMLTDIHASRGNTNDLLSHADQRSQAVYDRLFHGCNLPAVTPEGQWFEPRWSVEECRSLAQLLRLGLAELEAALPEKS